MQVFQGVIIVFLCLPIAWTCVLSAFKSYDWRRGKRNHYRNWEKTSSALQSFKGMYLCCLLNSFFTLWGKCFANSTLNVKLNDSSIIIVLFEDLQCIECCLNYLTCFLLFSPPILHVPVGLLFNPHFAEEIGLTCLKLPRHLNPKLAFLM